MRLLYIAAAFLLAWVLSMQTHGAEQSPAMPVSSPDTMTVSLITCYPGKQVYELYGHSAIRIRNAEFDSIWNYGVFDFNSPNFIGRFVVGKTDYKLASSTTAGFLAPYQIDGRRVEEMIINLNQQEAARLLSALRTNALPENATYRYNYLSDNCSTRILDQFEKAAGDSIKIRTLPRFDTYREAMKRYHGRARWYALGVDIALGAEIDKPLTIRQQSFLPLELMRMLEDARFADGRPVSVSNKVIVDNAVDFTESRTADDMSPMFFNSILAVIGLICCMYYLYVKKINRVIYTIVFSLIGIGGLVLTFLIFFTSHPATNVNYLLIWLNPIGLIVPAFIWCKSQKLRWVVYPYMVASTFGIILFFILWPIFRQSINYSLIPIVFIDLIFSLTYTIIFFESGMKGPKALEKKN